MKISYRTNFLSWAGTSHDVSGDLLAAQKGRRMGSFVPSCIRNAAAISPQDMIRV